MFRQAMEDLKKWKDNPNKKPLIIRGARQVGKTWLMREFGRSNFDHTVYINFDGNERMNELFSGDMDVRRIITGLELEVGFRINPENTLIIFDEVQEVPRALTSLKYFNENAPEYQIVSAGSLLGTALHQGTSFPVGKVEFLALNPLNFIEFLIATGKEQFAELLKKGDFAMITSFRTKYIDALKHYYFVGGMPEVVFNFSQDNDFNKVREIQKRILDAYEQDFSKHAPHEAVPRIRLIWNSIPAQLAKENKKFIYGLVKESARAREYELAMLWLIDCGLLIKVSRITKPALPLKTYEDLKAFKLFTLDIGLLSCMSRLNPQTLLDGNALFKEFKGALTEQYVLQQLKSLKGLDTYYWSNDRGNSEIDFVIDNGRTIVPIEVKAEINLKSKSLKTYRDMFSPVISMRTSMSDYKKEDWLVNIPLYAVYELPSQIE
ncbi:MAG: ATP-binding protein [Desulfitobacteriaceae bacterium]